MSTDEENGIKVVKDIKKNYLQLEKSIVNQLNMQQRLHGTTIGTLRENIWQQLFEQIVPKKFVIQQSVFIIDSEMKVSKEVDLAIVDEMYTPYIFQYGKLKFVPIEAVVAVVECKSSSQKVDKLKEWSEAIQKLRTKSESIARMATGISVTAPPTQKSTRPIRIFCHMNQYDEDKLMEDFDFILSAIDLTENKKNQADGSINIRYEIESFSEWYKILNFYNVKESKIPEIGDLVITERGEEEDSKNKKIEKLASLKLSDYEVTGNSLLSFNFQFNQLLMLINNPIPFPHKAYVKMFNDKILDGEE